MADDNIPTTPPLRVKPQPKAEIKDVKAAPEEIAVTPPIKIRISPQGVQPVPPTAEEMQPSGEERAHRMGQRFMKAVGKFFNGAGRVAGASLIPAAELSAGFKQSIENNPSSKALVEDTKKIIDAQGKAFDLPALVNPVINTLNTITSGVKITVTPADGTVPVQITPKVDTAAKDSAPKR